MDGKKEPKGKSGIRKLWFFYFSLLVCWAIACYGEIARYCYDGTLFAREIAGRPYISDFVNTYAAGLLAQQAIRKQINIYDVNVQYDLQKKLVSPIVPEMPFYLQYPPYFFSLMLPLVPFRLPVAWLLWNFAGTALSIFSLLALAKQFHLPEPKNWLIIIATICSFPFWLSIEIGQTSLMLLPSLTFAACLIKQNRPVTAAAAAFASLVKIQYAPITFFAGWGAASFRFAGGYILSFLSLLALAYITVGSANVLRFPHALLAGETGSHISGVSVFSMENLRAQLSLLSGSENSTVTWIAATMSLLSSIVVGLIWWLIRRKSTIENISVQALLLAISFLTASTFSVHCHMQDLLLVAPAAICILASLEHSTRKTPAQKWLLGILIAYPLLSWIAFILTPIFLFCRIKIMFLTNCLLIIILLNELVRELRPNT